jgi:hypothetical protein
MSYPETHEIDDSPPDHAVAAVAQEYAVTQSEIRSRVVRYHDSGVTVVVSPTDEQL